MDHTANELPQQTNQKKTQRIDDAFARFFVELIKQRGQREAH
jgi:hypothetical protein